MKAEHTDFWKLLSCCLTGDCQGLATADEISLLPALMWGRRALALLRRRSILGATWHSLARLNCWWKCRSAWHGRTQHFSPKCQWSSPMWWPQENMPSVWGICGSSVQCAIQLFIANNWAKTSYFMFFAASLSCVSFSCVSCWTLPWHLQLSAFLPGWKGLGLFSCTI